jgi:exodeoxyribonuclease VII large subunit
VKQHLIRSNWQLLAKPTGGNRVTLDGRAEVLILARGGGATEDLNCFNSEIVVRAIAECPIPIVTGIGHERDESLADLAADIRATTPTRSFPQFFSPGDISIEKAC